MADDRPVDQLSLAELEAIVEERRRQERAREFAESESAGLFRPITVEPVPGETGRRRRRYAARGTGQKRTWRDRLLLLVEVIAALGLIGIIISSLGNLQTLNQEVAQAQQAARSTAVPQAITNAPKGELPGSSFPPANANLNELPGSSFPPDELPAALGVAVASAPSLPPPTPGPQSPTRIVIPALNVDWPIVEGDGWEELKRGVGHHIGSANPGERGNMVLAGHDDVFGEVFKEIGQLSDGAQVIVYAGGHTYHYGVRARRAIAPSDLSVLNPTREPVVTLITCTPYGVDTMRLVVIAQLIP